MSKYCGCRCGSGRGGEGSGLEASEVASHCSAPGFHEVSLERCCEFFRGFLGV